MKLSQHLIFLIVSTGKRMTPTWTRLSTTAAAGSSSITLNEAVNWPVGAKIVIPTTSDRHSQRENEMATIASISNGGMTLNLEQPLEYEHVCVSEVCTQAIFMEKFLFLIVAHVHCLRWTRVRTRTRIPVLYRNNEKSESVQCKQHVLHSTRHWWIQGGHQKHTPLSVQFLSFSCSLW